MNKLWCNIKRNDKTKTVTMGYITVALSIGFIGFMQDKII